MSLSHPLVGCSPGTLLRLARENGVDVKYWPRYCAVLLASLSFSPLRWAERLIYGRRLEKTSFGPAPVFIIGHWRSGTTHLHNLMALDPQFAHLTTFQATLPECSLISKRGVLRRVVSALLPATRPMDNMVMSVDGPYEEEFAAGNLSTMAVTHGMWFPRKLAAFFDHTVFFDNENAAVTLDWQRSYGSVLRRVAYGAEGKRLLLKNPPNTARIPALLAMFPDAKFVHIYRNPYEVFASTVRLYTKLMEGRAFHSVSVAEIEAHVLRYYQRVMTKFFETRQLIPRQNLVELRYEELEQDPLLALKGVYEGLGLSGFDTSKPLFSDYVASLVSYEKNRFEYSAPLIERVAQAWGDTIARWGYAPPASS